MKDLLLDGIINGIIRCDHRLYNPVFLYGEEKIVAGVLSTIASEYQIKNPDRRIIRVSGDDFNHGMIHAIKGGYTELFQKIYRSADLLIFEHVERIAGRQGSMIEFYELFDHVFMKGGSIVIAGEFPPSVLGGLDDRIRTQLEGGMIHNVKA